MADKKKPRPPVIPPDPIQLPEITARIASRYAKAQDDEAYRRRLAIRAAIEFALRSEQVTDLRQALGEDDEEFLRVLVVRLTTALYFAMTREKPPIEEIRSAVARAFRKVPTE